ncbi:unnamed protein product [Blepharisma stoltei]|uniref:Uncharacterized protein n=1 Tax=Blepharisma stoltei TaxID=1481888 RepID=A0AAU9KBG2_9CILI|nr:unnamed protein product [Blepharisma stoltei]
MKLPLFEKDKAIEHQYLWYSPDFDNENCVFYRLDLENFNANRLQKSGFLYLYENDFLWDRRMRTRFFYICKDNDLEIGAYLLSRVGGWTRGFCKSGNFIYNFTKTQYIGVAGFRFNLLKWRAEWLSILPKDAKIKSIIEFDGKIVISTLHSKWLFIYDCFTNSHSKIKSIFDQSGMKHFYKNKNKLYIFDYGKNIIYVTKSCFGEWEVLSKICENIDYIGTEWFPQLYSYYKDSIYISIKGKIYRYDFDEKGLILIGEIILDKDNTGVTVPSFCHFQDNSKASI